MDKTFVLDQPFPVSNPLNSMRLFGEDSKAIVVIRDPRDMYYLIRDYDGTYGYGWAPSDINSFIGFYKTMYSYRYKNKNILYVKFEDLVFKYDETVKTIEKFCGINSKNHINKK